MMIRGLGGIGGKAGSVSHAVGGFFPGRCAVCGATGASPCRACVVPIRSHAVAPRVVVPLWCSSVVSPFAYDGSVRTIITASKYRGSTRGLVFLAGRMAEAVLAARPDFAEHAEHGERGEHGEHGETLVTWAPTSPQRHRRRGYDQAQLLAQHTAMLLGLRCERLLVHRSDSQAQTGASRHERSLRVERFRPVPLSAGSLSGGVLLIDDVMTTGATLSGAARVLRDAGAPCVNALVAAVTL